MLKVGFWICGIGIEGGGVSPYARRIYKCFINNLKNYQNEIELKVIGRRKDLDVFNKIGKNFDLKNSNNIIIDKRGYAVNKYVNKLIKFAAKLNTNVLKYNLDYQYFAKLNIDFLHIPIQTFPQNPYQLFKIGSLPKPTVITMHDVQHLHFPAYFEPKERLKREKKYLSTIESADKIIVSYNHVKKDLLKFYNISEEKIHVCPIPLEQISFKKPNIKDVEILKNKYSKKGDFLLYPAQTWPHKNHINLIKALKIINEQGKKMSLICTGKKNKHFFKKIKPFIQKSNLDDMVKFVGLVPEKELYWLYKNTKLVVVPTKYEAGSFPVMEAMALQAPVICSNVTSLPNTIGSSEYIFNPDNVHEIAQKIVDFAFTENNRQKNIKINCKKYKTLCERDAFKPFLKLWRTFY